MTLAILIFASLTILDFMTSTLCSEMGVNRHALTAAGQSADPTQLPRAVWEPAAGGQDPPGLSGGQSPVPSEPRKEGLSFPESLLSRQGPRSPFIFCFRNKSLCHCALLSFRFSFKKRRPETPSWLFSPFLRHRNGLEGRADKQKLLFAWLASLCSSGTSK